MNEAFRRERERLNHSKRPADQKKQQYAIPHVKNDICERPT